MTQKNLTSEEFSKAVQSFISKIDDDLYAHNFGETQVREQIENLECDSEAVQLWVESLEFRFNQARLAACDAWNLSLCDLMDDLSARIGAEVSDSKTQTVEAEPTSPKKKN